MEANGVGRGGRGAALLRALQNPPRKPGIKSVTETIASPQVLPTAKGDVVVATGGRGQLMAALQKYSQSTSGTPSPSSAPRGIEALRSALEGPGAPSDLSRYVGRSVSPATVTSVQSVIPDLNSMSLENCFDNPKIEGVSFCGNRGQKIDLTVNCVRVNCDDHYVHQYHVSFQPDVINKNIRIRLVNDIKSVIGDTKAFDGSTLYLPHQLEQKETKIESKMPTDQSDVTIHIRYVYLVPPEKCLHLYNVIFKRIMRILNMKRVGRKYYSPQSSAVIPQHKLEMWPGYITTVHQYDGGLLLTADASHRVLSQESILDFLYNAFHSNPQNFKEVAIKALIGCIVITRYNNRTYRIDDIDWTKNPTHSFILSSNGSTVTFIDYYKNHHGKDVHDPDQPLLVHRPKRRDSQGQPADSSDVLYLIPELCYMTGLTDAMRSDFRVMQDIATHTRITPAQRQMALRKYVESVTSNEEASNELRRWGLTLSHDTLKLQGRQVDREVIIFGSGSVQANMKADWNTESCNNEVLLGVPLKSWLLFYTKRDATKASDFLKLYTSSGPRMGIEVSVPTMIELVNDRTDTFVTALRKNINKSVQMVVIISPTNRTDRYSAIKRLCCSEIPVPSQVIIARTLNQKNKVTRIVQKIALQINCKLGGELWTVEIPLNNLMIMGIDVFHSSTEKSVGAMVCSLNPSMTRWYSKTAFQTSHQELIDTMETCCISSLMKYHEVNHRLPDKIVVFRDGVSDGQLKTVASYEVKQLQKAFDAFQHGYCPKLTFIVVQKRINTRIYLQNDSGVVNPMPGAVVDHAITKLNYFDYYLVSQHVRQGTVTPTHYVVVYNSSGLSPDHIQRLSHKMTHMYYNWPGTVRVPAPCQYAHKLAFLVGQNIGKDPSPELLDRLFYL